MRVDDVTTELRRLGGDPGGVVALEYALIAAMIAISIMAVLEVIGGQSLLGLPPILDALEASAGS